MSYNISFPWRLFLLDIEVSCYGYDGIDAVKDALMSGLGLSTEEMPIKVSSDGGLVIALVWDFD